MSVYQRPDSPYWWMLLERDGAPPLRLSTTIKVKAFSPDQATRNRALAEAAYDAAKGDLARARFQLPGGRQTRTVRDQAEWYLEHHTQKHDGARQEVRRIEQLIGYFGDLPLSAVTATRWTEYATIRLKAVAKNTLGNELTVLKGILASAIGESLDVSPLLGVKRRKEKLPAKRTITKQEESPFLAALKQEDTELHDLYVVGVGTLLRQDNLLNLQRKAHRGASLALLTKTGPLQVPLTSPTPLQRRAAKVLHKRMPATTNGYFFPEWQKYFASFDDPGHPRVQFLRIVQRAAEAADIPWGIREGGIVWHTATRATGATRMLRDYKVDIRTVQMIGGWSSLDQMMEYLGVDRTVFNHVSVT